jgi:acetoin utilization protein AcuC
MEKKLRYTIFWINKSFFQCTWLVCVCKTAVFFGKELAKYGFGESHPFNSNRIYSFWSKFNEMNLSESDRITIEKPETVQDEILRQFHDADYVDTVKASSKAGAGFLDIGDTPAFKGVYEASCYVVGTSLKALYMVMERTDGVLHAFSPIGGLHHAKRNSAGGFCVFNDIGVVIMMAKKRYDVKRISYVDIDAHHGDGVYYGFEGDSSVFVADIHEDGRYLYPGTGNETETGSGDAKGTKLNIPLKPGSNDDDFIVAFKKVEDFIDSIARPELIIFQCGADGIGGDPLTHLRFTSKSHAYAADKLHHLSHKHCNGRLISLGGGGYNHTNIAEGWTAVISSLIRDV